MPRHRDLRPDVPTLLLALAVAASAALLLALGSGLTFFQDVWAFLLDRPGWTANSLLAPHNEHIVVIPVAIFKTLVAMFGMDTAAPERVVLTAMLLVTAVLAFIYMRRRVGPWAALIGTVVLLFLGPAWEVLLWPFEITLLGSVLAGVAMLLMLEREDRRGDIAASALAVVSVGFSSLGVAFALGAGADVLARSRSRGFWRRLYVPAIPLLVYAAWYLGYGHEAQSAVSAHNILHSPVFLVKGFVASTSALLGLSRLAINSDNRVPLGVLMLAVLGVVALYGLRRPRLPTRIWGLAASAAAFWLLAGFNQIPGREATASRYLYVGAVFVLLLAADLLEDMRFGRRSLAVGAVVMAGAVTANLFPLVDGRNLLREQSDLTKADLGALEIARRTVDPGFTLFPAVAGTPSLINVAAGRYFAAADAHGSPADTPGELARAPAANRWQADVMLAAALPISTAVEPGRKTDAGRCRRLPASPHAPNLRVPLPPGVSRIITPPGHPAAIGLERFGGGWPGTFVGVPPGSTARIAIPPDTLARPWRAVIHSRRSVLLCSRTPMRADGTNPGG